MDYRVLNKLTIPDELFDELRGTIFSKLDIKLGYY